jgi:hypothetical protein
MTDKEKAKKFDALKMAISFNAQIYANRRVQANVDYNSHEGIIKGYDKGQFDAYSEVVGMLEAWKDICSEGE